jgi:hypothetical protein
MVISIQPGRRILLIRIPGQVADVGKKRKREAMNFMISAI